jgi:hypothetical protein
MEQTNESNNVVNNSINIEKNNDRGQIKIVSKSNWFDTEYVIVTIYEDCIVINKPDLDYNGKMFKVLKIGQNNVVKLTMELPIGKFYFDTDESTEDELVMYFN